jgi:hypothetical protein
MRKSTVTYSALRASEHRTDVSFYEELAHKTLLTIGQLVDFSVDSEVSIYAIKQRMGINFAALAKIFDNLNSKRYISMQLSGAVNVGGEIGPEDVVVSLTHDGLNEILKKLND